MSLILPFKTATFSIYETDEPRAHTITLVVQVVDEFTQQRVSTPVRVVLAQKTADGAFEEKKPIRNLGGDFCFEDQPAATYTLLAEPDPLQDYYFLRPEPAQPWVDGFSRDVILPLGSGPELVVTFSPKPGYPFPPGTTLACGKVVDNAGASVNRAVVSTAYDQSLPTVSDPDAFVTVTAETRTDSQGFFAIFFRSLPASSTNVQVTATEGIRQVVQQVQIKERETASVPLLQFP